MVLILWFPPLTTLCIITTGKQVSDIYHNFSVFWASSSFNKISFQVTINLYKRNLLVSMKRCLIYKVVSTNFSDTDFLISRSYFVPILSFTLQFVFNDNYQTRQTSALLVPAEVRLSQYSDVTIHLLTWDAFITQTGVVHLAVSGIT